MREEMCYKKILPNGITVIAEEIPYLRSISLGIWVKTGSRDEDTSHNGISHFLEHLAFKGTKRRTARQIAIEVDSIGGHIDAYTSREHTSYSAKILDEHFPVAVDILSDILLHSVYDKEEIEKERNVILEEVKMVDDSPTDALFDFFYRNVWQDHPLGQPIQGTKESVNNINRDDILQYLDNHYSPGNIIITAAGNLKHDQFIDLIGNAFDCLERKGAAKGKDVPHFNQGVQIKQKDLEQVHFFLGLPGFKSNDDDRYKAYLMNIILGGSMSSRLFQRIREERGLAYSIYSFNNTYEDSGVFGVYAGTSPESVSTTVELTINEVRGFLKEKVSKDDLRKAKDQLKGNIILSLESSSSRMNQIARQELYFGKRFSVDEISASIERVTREDIQGIANRLFHDKTFSLSAIGNLDESEISADMLKI